MLAWLSVWSEVQTAYGPADATVSCFSKIQIGFTFLVPAHLGSPGKGPLDRCVCGFVNCFAPDRKRGVLWWACLSVFVCPRPYLHNYMSNLYLLFLCMLPMAIAQSSSGGVVMLCISGFVDDVIFEHKLIGCSTSPPGWGSEAHTYTP